MRWTVACVLAGALIGCDRPSVPVSPASRGATSRPAAEAERADDPPGVVTPDVGATTRAVAAGKILVEGRELDLPPAKLEVGKNGNVVLLADGGASGNSIMLTFRPTTDGEVPWRHATWRWKLTSRDAETTDGIYVGGPDHQLRAVELEVDVERAEGGAVAEVGLRGAYVRADADDPLSAERFNVVGTLQAGIEDQGR